MHCCSETTATNKFSFYRVSKAPFIRRISAVSNAIETIDNDSLSIV